MQPILIKKDIGTGLMAASARRAERADCVVRAFAACLVEREQGDAEAAYRFAHAAVKHACGRANRKGCPRWQMAAKPLGLCMTEIFVTGHTIRTVTLELPKTGRYILKVKGHVAAVVDGVCHDWAAGKCMRIISVWHITDSSASDAIASQGTE